MTFDFPPPENADSCAETAEQCPFSEEEWDAIEALAEPGAIY
ncbi:hypothetical protein [Alteromonas sp. 07-89-2]|nr:hypothetical protein [Alteromonas sp. 07-89-2]MEC9430180.1 hypothetical protein [Pseudomonadota bacterium]